LGRPILTAADLNRHALTLGSSTGIIWAPLYDADPGGIDRGMFVNDVWKV
jgi:hypothetical protein